MEAGVVPKFVCVGASYLKQEKVRQAYLMCA